MNRSSQLIRRCRAVLVPMLVMGALLRAAAPAHADKQESVVIVPPDGVYQGKTYDEWAVKFWQWMMGLPLEGHPLIDDPDFDFTAAQKGPVWYWGAPDGPLTRSFSMPEGTAFFLTIRDVDTSTLEAAPFFGATEAEQRAGSNWFADHIDRVECAINAVSVENIRDFRFETEQFKFKAPTPWIFAEVGGKGTAVGDGYFLMILLPEGRHTITYFGNYHFDTGEVFPGTTEALTEPLDLPHQATIEITVVKDQKKD